jgi:geranylgeranyl diphosphate synthase type I
MDSSATRRGRPSTHKAFEAVHREQGWPGPPEQYGAAAAILLGDLLLCWSDELLRGCGLPHEAVRTALGFFETSRSEVITGQFLDVSVQARGTSDVEQAMQVLRYKSAKYSVERPLHVGAALAGGGGDVIEALTRFGLPLGEAFQLRDDLLGVYGDPTVTGKPAGDDLTEGKRTVLIALTLEQAPAAEAKLLDEALGSPLTGAEVEELRRIITTSGAHDEVERRIQELTASSLGALDDAPLAERAREVLRDLAAAATQRAI